MVNEIIDILEKIIINIGILNELIDSKKTGKEAEDFVTNHANGELAWNDYSMLLLANPDKIDQRLTSNQFEISFRGTICKDLERLIGLYNDHTDIFTKELSEIFDNWPETNLSDITNCIKEWEDKDILPEEFDSSLIRLLEPLKNLSELINLC